MNTSINITKTESDGGILINVEGLKVYRRKKTSGWVCYSPNLKVIGYSVDGEEESLNDFELSLRIFFKVHIERDSLNYALDKLGWTKNEEEVNMFPIPFEYQGLPEQDYEFAIPA